MEKIFSLKDNRTLVLREPVLDDALSLIAFHQQVGGETDFLLSDEKGIPGLDEERERAYLKNTLEAPNTRMYLAFVDGALAGLADVRGAGQPRLAHNGSVGIVVRRDHWGLGIGGILMAELIAFARATGALSRLELSVRADNQRAIALYQRFGFAPCGRMRHQMRIKGNYYDALYMELLL